MTFMKTDYSKIADQYDRNPLRQKPVDPEIAELIKTRDALSIVDLGCGTGNYLAAQRAHYSGHPITWYGIDFSPEMLTFARKKNPDVRFMQGDAAKMTPQTETIDYVRNEFSFHHFPDKPGVAVNIYNMLKPGGLLIMDNICPEYMNNSWVNRYFPSTVQIDADRFLSAQEIYQLFSDTGFTVQASIAVEIFELDLETRIKEVENRDMSQLHLISDREYEEGLSGMRSDLRKNRTVVSDFARLSVRAEKI